MKIGNSAGTFHLLAVALLLLFAANNASAADPQLTSLTVKHHESGNRTFGIGDTIEVEISGLSDWRKAQPIDQKGVVIYIDGVPFQNAELERADDNRAEFRLTRDPDDETSRKAWNRLLNKPTQFKRTVPIAVGAKNRTPWPSADADLAKEGVQTQTLDLTILWAWGFWIYIFFLTGLVWAIAKLSSESNLLRDGIPDQPGVKGTFSLSRSQMAFWILIILGAYLFIWLVTGAIDTLSATALGLLGISGGTGFISILIDRSKQSVVEAGLKKAEDQQALVRQDIQSGGGVASAIQYQSLTNANKAIQNASEQLKQRESEGFLRDILSDENGVTMHRLQMVIWNLVLGVIFLVSVYQGLSMPELSGTLLGLMGISSATYLGMKGPEKQN